MSIFGNNRSLSAHLPVQILAVSLLLLLLCLMPAVGSCAKSIAHANTLAKTPNLDLRVDKDRQARAFCNGMQAIVSIAGFFEFYEKSVNGERKRIFAGPWNGLLERNANGAFSLSGNDLASGTAYAMRFRQVDPSSVEIEMTFKAPTTPSQLGFDIVKLAGDIFKGSQMEASPAELTDLGRIPLAPLSFSQRMLLTSKNRVLVRSSLCDLEITDLTGSRSIVAADSRNVPWDKEKSILFCGGKERLSPGTTYSFRYSIRCLPPTGLGSVKNMRPSSGPVAEVNDWSFYALPPKEEHKKAGHYQLQPQDAIYGSPSGTAEVMLARELEKLTALRLPIKNSEQESSGSGVFIERTPPQASSGLSPERFEIVTTPDKIIIKGASERACLYGVYTVIGRLKHAEKGWQMQCGTIGDWPDLAIRGTCIEMVKAPLPDVALMKSYLDALSRARSNTVIFLHSPPHIRSWQENVNDGGWTKEQVAEIAAHARWLHMDVWGGLTSNFKRSDFKEMGISTGTNLYNPFSERAYQQLFSLYDQLLQTYRPSTLLIGHDEIRGLSQYSLKSGKSSAEILSTDVARIHAWLSHRSVRTAMWGDMLLDYNEWDKPVGAANSRNPGLNSGATHTAIRQIPSDTLIIDWHYNEKNDFGSIDYFRKSGFGVIGATWHNPLVSRTMARSAQKYGGEGVIATDWGFWRTLSPAATTLYAPLCGWSTRCTISEDHIDASALAKTMRDRDDSPEAVGYAQYPVGLEPFANAATTGLFGIGGVLDLSALAPGSQPFAGITFEILADKAGAASNTVVVAQDDHGLPKERQIFQGKRLARSVAFLHTAFIEEPQLRPRKIGCYDVEYENGRFETVELLENWNITDIRSSEGLRHNDWTFTRSPDVLIGARTGWRGFTAGGMPINLQVLVWRNPHPEEKIRTIKLSASTAPAHSKIALVGLTFLE